MLSNIRRPIHGRYILGVAEGLAEYFQTDPLIIRLIFIILTPLGGSGIWIYLLLALMIPEEKNHSEETIKSIEQTQRSAHDLNILGVVLIVLGSLFLLENFFPDFGIMKLWPLLLIYFGISMVKRKN